MFSKKGTFEGLFEKKGTLSANFAGGEGGFRRPLCPPHPAPEGLGQKYKVLTFFTSKIIFIGYF